MRFITASLATLAVLAGSTTALATPPERADEHKYNDVSPGPTPFDLQASQREMLKEFSDAFGGSLRELTPHFGPDSIGYDAARDIISESIRDREAALDKLDKLIYKHPNVYDLEKIGVLKDWIQKTYDKLHGKKDKLVSRNADPSPPIFWDPFYPHSICDCKAIVASVKEDMPSPLTAEWFADWESRHYPGTGFQPSDPWCIESCVNESIDRFTKKLEEFAASKDEHLGARPSPVQNTSLSDVSPSSTAVITESVPENDTPTVTLTKREDEGAVVHSTPLVTSHVWKPYADRVDKVTKREASEKPKDVVLSYREWFEKTFKDGAFCTCRMEHSSPVMNYFNFNWKPSKRCRKFCAEVVDGWLEQEQENSTASASPSATVEPREVKKPFNPSDALSIFDCHLFQGKNCALPHSRTS